MIGCLKFRTVLCDEPVVFRNGVTGSGSDHEILLNGRRSHGVHVGRIGATRGSFCRGADICEHGCEHQRCGAGLQTFVHLSLSTERPLSQSAYREPVTASFSRTEPIHSICTGLETIEQFGDMNYRQIPRQMR